MPVTLNGSSVPPKSFASNEPPGGIDSPLAPIGEEMPREGWISQVTDRLRRYRIPPPKGPPPGSETTTQGREPTIITGKKERILALIVTRLATDLAVLDAAARTAHQAAIDEENIPDNKYDTLSLEASYVAQGQANRAQKLRGALAAYQGLALLPFTADAKIRLTALVTLEGEDDSTRSVFIGPQEGGLKVILDGEEITVITPASPLGRALIGKCVGDEIEAGEESRLRRYEIVEVC